MTGELAPFPVDDATLAAVEHALGGVLSCDAEHGGTVDEPVLIRADYSLSTLLDFLSNTTETDHPLRYRIDQNGDRIDPEQAARDDALGADQWWIDERPHYTERDVIAALIAEVRRLRPDHQEEGP